MHPTCSNGSAFLSRTLLTAGALSLGAVCFPQTYTGSGASIPDDDSTNDHPITVSGLAGPIDTLLFGLESVCINIEHDRLADLTISIVAPDGANALLSGFNGGNGHFYTNTCFRADATLSVTNNSSPFTGNFRPHGPMGLVNNGQNGNGVWKLRIRDANPGGNTGELIDWSLSFGDEPANFFHLASTNLPIVVINTGNVTIVDDPKIPGTMGIINNAPGERNYTAQAFNEYNGNIAIELRGNSSQTFPKKSYGFELRNALDQSYSTSLLGMPPESDWVLSGNYSDKSLLNNPLTFDLGQRMGHYAPRWKHVELILNNEYLGVFVLTEKIKRDEERVDIAKLTVDEISGDDLTGGYIVKLDWDHGSNTGGWTSPYPPAESALGQTTTFLYDYPQEPAAEQAEYIAAYIDSFETALAGPDFADPLIGYRKYIATHTFIDFFLVNELARNVDGYRLSTFLHKDKASNGGQLHIGPLWDFDIGWDNANYCDGSVTEGWAYQFGEVCAHDQKQMPFWWARFMEDPVFVERTRCRWEELREDVFSVERLHTWCDSMATWLDESQERNFDTWEILDSYVWPNPQPVPATYGGEVDELKTWITDRTAWMDANLPGLCTHTGLAETAAPIAPRIFPMPFASSFTVVLPENMQGVVDLTLIDALGRTVYNTRKSTAEHGNGPWTVSPSASLAPGSYVLHLRTANASWSGPVMKVLPD